MDNIAQELLDGTDERKTELIEKITKWDEIKAKEKAEAERIEAERKQKIQDAILKFRTDTTALIMEPGKTSKQLDEITEKLESYEPNKDYYGEFMTNIELEKDMLIGQSRSMADAARVREQAEYDRVKDEYFELFKEIVITHTIEDMQKAIEVERARIQKIADQAQEQARKEREAEEAAKEAKETEEAVEITDEEEEPDTSGEPAEQPREAVEKIKETEPSGESEYPKFESRVVKQTTKETTSDTKAIGDYLLAIRKYVVESQPKVDSIKGRKVIDLIIKKVKEALTEAELTRIEED